MKPLDVNGIDIKVGSKIRYLRLQSWRKMVLDDTYSVTDTELFYGQINVTSESTGKDYYVYPTECEVIHMDPIEFVEELPI